ncbi:DUF2147 domain-containing protein [Salipiger sp. H15]|uniref:DUF2147 domain-containing protein n=2 Tax=Alloyangia sp. H15 TaxID=3029062 RepID=A0AAU8AQJ0_9RHOB
MKRLAPLACVLALTAAPALAADPVLGNWQTQPGDDGHFGVVTMAPCGSRICGTLSHAFDAGGTAIPSSNLGRQIVWDMQPEGEGKYDAGRIWAPDRDKTYKSRMELSGDQLKVYGCVLGVCRGQTWTRVQ